MWAWCARSICGNCTGKVVACHEGRSWKLGEMNGEMPVIGSWVGSFFSTYPIHPIVEHPGCSLLYRIGGAGTPKTFDSGEPTCTPTLLQNQGPWAGKPGKRQKTTHFGHFWTVLGESPFLSQIALCCLISVCHAEK